MVNQKHHFYLKLFSRIANSSGILAQATTMAVINDAELTGVYEAETFHQSVTDNKKDANEGGDYSGAVPKVSTPQNLYRVSQRL